MNQYNRANPVNPTLRTLCAMACLCLLFASSAREEQGIVPARVQQQGMQQQIWFGTIDTITGRDMHRPDPLAYMNFFQPDAPWKQSAARLQVFTFSTQFLLSSTDEQLTTVFNDLRRRNIAIGVEMGASQREEGCGGGEGYLPLKVVDIVGKRLTRHGFKLDYMSMDEPIWFAHEVSWGKQLGQRPCHYPLPKLVTQVALTVNHMRQYFPDLKVGDIEVVADYADRNMDWHQVIGDYAEFARLFERATGTKLAYFHCDIAWRTNWRPDIAPLASEFHQQGIRFGAIIGGTPLDTTDQAFVNTGLARLRELQSNPATRLDDIVVDSWQPRPSKFLPETEPGTMTNLLLRSEAVVGAPMQPGKPRLP